MTDTGPRDTDDTDMRSIIHQMECARRPSPAMARIGMAWQAARAVAFIAIFMHVYRNPHNDFAYIFAGYLMGDFSVMLITGFHQVLRHPAAALFDLGAFAGLLALLMGAGAFASDAAGIHGFGIGGAFLGYLGTIVLKFGWYGLISIQAED